MTTRNPEASSDQKLRTYAALDTARAVKLGQSRSKAEKQVASLTLHEGRELYFPNHNMGAVSEGTRNRMVQRAIEKGIRVLGGAA